MTLPISNIAPISIPSLTAPSGATGASGEFQNVLQNAIGTVQGLQNDASTAVQNFLSGQNEELHTTVLATQRAEMAFELGLQVRNKVVSAYQEIMKMQL
ncbi:MAG: flagellar hook-basal body complex protein FliE [Bryobacteraceae bacterium]|jgi:flagellar hook-basal body complex protein FliE